MATATALLVVVLVTAGEGEDVSTKTAAKVAEDALAGDAVVTVRETESEAVTDAEATQLATSLHADVVVVVRWLTPDKQSVLVHVHSAPTNRSSAGVDRRLSFEPNDALVERGRTLGFEIASMIPRRWAQPPLPEASSAAHSSPLPEPVAVRWAVDAVASGGIGAGAGGLGGDLAGRADVGSVWGAHLAGGARFGSLDAANASSQWFKLALGPTLRFFGADPAPVRFGLRLDGCALWQHVSRRDNASRDGRLVPGGALVVEGGFRFARAFSVVAGAGLEVAFGRTDILVDARSVASVSPVRGVFELGFRWELGR